MKWVFWMTGNYGSHPDDKYDPNALPLIRNINYRDMVAENVTMAAGLEGIPGDTFTGICISNVRSGARRKRRRFFGIVWMLKGFRAGWSHCRVRRLNIRVRSTLHRASFRRVVCRSMIWRSRRVRIRGSSR
ncbi:probable polygalacturonase [Phtheirospermum japonicum]|uniref:Probable polygalacturonase n=1 Tax=Phtheirospermum japonicum TaxID=374723 RepID=A0A830CHJ3_9LAMI|nr:probable polygalacturonase [Phtheirospermum japonicum]